MSFELAVISPEDNSVLNELEVVLTLFKQGLTRFHLRKPNWKKATLIAYLDNIPKEFRNFIYLHYHSDIAKEYGVKCHLRYDQWSEKGENAYCDSVSVHNWDEFKAIDGKIGQCTISPLFNSTSKTNYHQNPKLLHLPTKSGQTNVIALGGIGIGNIAQVQQLGFDGAAVLGAIWNRPQNSVEVFNALKAQISAITEKL